MTRFLSIKPFVIACLGAGLVSQTASADTTPPIITVESQVAECRNPSTSIQIPLNVSDNVDPLPVVNISNDCSTCSDVNPDEYPFGSHWVTVTASDNSGNIASEAVNVIVQDTLAPSVRFDTSPAGCLASSTNVTCECNAPGGSVIDINPSQFLVTDLCDPNPIALYDFPEDNVYEYGESQVTATVYDLYMNGDSEIITINVLDSTPPVIVATPSNFTVVSQVGECFTMGGLNGSWVRLPRPSATDACTAPADIVYTWSHSTHFNESVNPEQCLPDGNHTIELKIYDAQGNQPQADMIPSFSVNVASAGSLPLTVESNGPSGFTNAASVTVTGTVTGAAGGSVNWVAISGQVPNEGSNQTTALNDTVTYTFGPEEIYCPVYLSATVGGDVGADSSTCFAIDRTAPTHNFAGMGTSRPGVNDSTQTIDVDPADATTWPVFFHGEKLTLEFDATDLDGQTQSGVQSVDVTIINADTGVTLVHVANQAVTCAEGELNSCNPAMRVEGCDSNSPACINNKLSFGSIGNGNFKLRLSIEDGAGNQSVEDYPFIVGNIITGLEAQVSWLQYLIDDPAVEEEDQLRDIQDLLVDASAIFVHSPGHAFLLARRAYSNMMALNDTAIISANLKRAILSESRRIVEIHTEKMENNVLTDWSILSNPDPIPEGEQGTNEYYKDREWLVGTNLVEVDGRFYPEKDHLVEVDETLNLAGVELSRSQEAVDPLTSIDYALNAFDTLVMLFQDSTYAELYDRPANETEQGNVEGFYRSGSPARFGDSTSLTVDGQMTRFANDASDGRFSGITQDILANLITIQTEIENFADYVQTIQENDWANGEEFNNQIMIEEIYMSAVDALLYLRDPETSNGLIYTHYWQGGLILSLGYIVNFSMYEGETSLYNILGNANTVLTQNRKMLKDNGGFWTTGGVNDLDQRVQVSECRYNKLMQALSDGRIAGTLSDAVNTFVDSKCLIIALYNENYLDQNSVGVYIPSDGYINPADYGCEGVDIDVDVNGECSCFGNIDPAGGDGTCDGFDDDCDGLIDEDYTLVSCGFGPCENTSACVNGTEVECIPLAAQVTVDTSCDAIDNDCDGIFDEEWVPDTCGLGGCLSVNSCTETGIVTICTPLPAAESPDELSCDGEDNDCDISADEGLDNDRDGYGCEPGSVNCNRENAPPVGDAYEYYCSNDVDGNGSFTGTWDCNDADSTVGPGLDEVCDYKDNNCNCPGDTNGDGVVCGVGDDGVDEGVLNACGHCGANCNETVFGGDDGLPFNPTGNNSVSIIVNEDDDLEIFSEQVDVEFAWVGVDSAGYVSKIDTTTGKEVGRYCSALGPNAASVDNAIEEPTYGRTRGIPNVCEACGSCNRGSRTAVDARGNVFLANRAFSSQGSITKIANLERDCVDINNNGVIETSGDYNDNGVIDMNVGAGEAQEYYAENDECILWTRKPAYYENGTYESKGDGYYLPRALAIDAEGDIWLGNFNSYGFFEVNSDTGKIKRWVGMGVRPYGAVIDGRGILWAPNSCCHQGQIQSFNTNDYRVPQDTGLWNSASSTAKWEANQLHSVRTQPGNWNRGTYGIAIDQENRVWLGNHGKSWNVGRYEPQSNTWTKFGTDSMYTRGVTVDAAGTVWISAYPGSGQQGRIMGYDSNTGTRTKNIYMGNSGKAPLGIGIGSSGKIWTANCNTNNLTVLDPTTDALGFYPNDVAGGTNLGGSLYTYSDFTGNLRATFTDPQGDYKEIIDGCFGPTVSSWDYLDWTLTTQPAGSVAKFQVRVGDDPDGDDWSQWYPSDDTYYDSSPASLSDVPSGNRFIQTRMVLVANESNQSPILYSFSVARTCQQQ